MGRKKKTDKRYLVTRESPVAHIVTERSIRKVFAGEQLTFFFECCKKRWKADSTWFSFITPGELQICGQGDHEQLQKKTTKKVPKRNSN